MAETISGGAYLTTSGQWIDANGAPLDKARAAEAEHLHEQQAAARAEAEAAARALDASRDPAGRAIAAALAPMLAPKAAKGEK